MRNVIFMPMRKSFDLKYRKVLTLTIFIFNRTNFKYIDLISTKIFFLDNFLVFL